MHQINLPLSFFSQFDGKSISIFRSTSSTSSTSSDQHHLHESKHQDSQITGTTNAKLIIKINIKPPLLFIKCNDSPSEEIFFQIRLRNRLVVGRCASLKLLQQSEATISDYPNAIHLCYTIAIRLHSIELLSSIRLVAAIDMGKRGSTSISTVMDLGYPSPSFIICREQ